MIGVGTFELGIGLPLGTLILYFVFRGRASSAPVLLVVALALILGIFIAALVAYAELLGPLPVYADGV